MKYLKKIIEYLFYLFIFFLPWQTRWIWFEDKLNGGYFEYGSFSLYGTDILFIFLFISVLIYLIWNFKNKTSYFQKIKEKLKNIEAINCIIIAFIIFIFISVLGSLNNRLAFYTAFRFLQGSLLLLLILFAGFSFRKVAWSFIFSSLIQSFLALYQFITQTTFSNKWLGLAFHDAAAGGTFVVETVLRRWLRAYGSLPHPNMLAGFLVISLLLLITLYLQTSYGYKKIILMISFIIVSFALLASFSRSALLALVFGIIIFWLKILFKKTNWDIKISLIKFTFLILLIAIIFGLIYSEPVLVRLAGEQRLELKSSLERLTYSSQALSLIKNNWFWGLGIGNYTLSIYILINPFWSVWQYQPVHNIFLLSFAELGIIGFSIFVFLFIITFLKTAKSKINSWQNIYFIIFVLLFLIGFFDHYLWTLHFGILIFWLNLGLLLKSKVDIK